MCKSAKLAMTVHFAVALFVLLSKRKKHIQTSVADGSILILLA